MHFTIATHYCGGELAASKASFSGELASCGMEGPDNKCSTRGNHLDSNCCRNKVSAFSVDNNFAPSFTEFTSFAQHIFQVYIVPEYVKIHSLTTTNRIGKSVMPPGNFLLHAVSLPKICVFLI